jgi:hypothetical protein
VPIPDKCTKVGIDFKDSGSRKAAVVFDKPNYPGSPGRALAYFNRGNYIYVPIDDRDVVGDDEFKYSIYVDCPANGACSPLDPMIIVER